MGAKVNGSSNLAKQLCDILGLKNVRKLEIEIETESIAVCKAEMYIETDQLRKMIPIIGEFELVPKKAEITDSEDERDITSIGDRVRKYQ